MDAQIAFPATLRPLLQQSRFKGNRQDFVAALGLKETVYSQYLNGKSKPKLRVLVHMAELLGVSLDELVLGKLPAAIEPNRADRALFEHFSHGMAALESRLAAGVRINEIIMRQFSDKLKQEVSGVIDKFTNPAALLHDDELLTIEGCSRRVRLIRLGLEYATESPSLARAQFIPTIIANLAQGRRYDYFLPKAADPHWPKKIDDFRQQLKPESSSEKSKGKLNVKLIEEDFVVGCVVYLVNLEKLKAKNVNLEPKANKIIRIGSGEEAWMGFTLTPLAESQVNPIMDQKHLANALRVLDALDKKYSGYQSEIDLGRTPAAGP